MGTETPFNAMPRMLASHPRRWEKVTRSDTAYLRGNAAEHEVAIALMSYDGGTIMYHDPTSNGGSPKEIKLQPGQWIPGEFVRVMLTSTTATEIWAGFMGES